MADEPRDRVRSVEASTAFNGIDFVEVVAPRALHVHFLNAVAIADPAIAATIDGGDFVLDEASVGLCVAGDQAPQGAVLILATQPQVSGL